VAQLVSSSSSEGRDRLLGKLEFIGQWTSGRMREHYAAQAEDLLNPPAETEDANGSTSWMEHSGEV